VRELVDDDVVARLAAVLGGGRAERHVLPRQQHRPARPRLARQLVVPFVHDAVLVELLPPHPELPGVDDDSHPALVRIEAEVEHREHRLHRDGEPDLVGQLEAAGAVHLLLVEKEERELPQPGELGVAHPGEERQPRDDAAPERVVDAGPAEDALAAPAPEQRHVPVVQRLTRRL
jgi:hypothetical protein